VTEPVIGVAFDGAGLGTDGAIWGGEFLLVAGARSQRLAHLAYVPLPGGDAAARNPARMALAHLFAAYGAELDSLPLALVEQSNPLLRTMLERGINSPPTSSVGRLFDAVAAILGVRMVAQFEAQAAMELESVADRTAAGSYPVEWREEGQGWTIETAPLIRAIVRDRVAGRPIPEIASRFHTALADLTLETVRRISRHTGIRRVTLTGGVFQNALLTERTADALVVHGFTVYVHRQVPCNDGGLAFGQVVVAAQSEELCA
jgi:hydrogenase maturation protein HypF